MKKNWMRRLASLRNITGQIPMSSNHNNVCGYNNYIMHCRGVIRPTNETASIQSHSFRSTKSESFQMNLLAVYVQQIITGRGCCTCAVTSSFFLTHVSRKQSGHLWSSPSPLSILQCLQTKIVPKGLHLVLLCSTLLMHVTTTIAVAVYPMPNSLTFRWKLHSQLE